MFFPINWLGTWFKHRTTVDVEKLTAEDLNKMSRNELIVTVKDLQVRVRKEMSSKRNTELELKKLRKLIFDVFLKH